MGTLSSTILGLPIRRASISTNDPVVERHGRREIDVHGGELLAAAVGIYDDDGGRPKCTSQGGI